MGKMDFAVESSAYLGRLASLRTENDIELIERFAAQIAGNSSHINIAIPCHVSETGLAQSIEAYLQSGLPEYSCVTVFINAGLSMSKIEFSASLKERKEELAALQKNFPELKLNILAEHFQRTASLSRIRGILFDTIVIDCAKMQHQDPILVSNDADALHYAPDYIKKIASTFASSPSVDYISGPIYWSGCDRQGRVYYKPALHLPEIILGDYLAEEADQIYREHGVVYSSGCNSAFRMSALCAVDAYNYEYEPFYDVEIGRQLNLMRMKIDQNSNLQDHAKYLHELALATNPRRAIYALLKKIPFGEQFDTFASVLGAHLPLEEYLKAYTNSRIFLQPEEFAALAKGENNAELRIKERLLANFLDFIKGEPTEHKYFLARSLGERVGLHIDELRQENGSLEDLKINWNKSSLADTLAKWISSPF